MERERGSSAAREFEEEREVFGVEIRRVENGFIVKALMENREMVFEDSMEEMMGTEDEPLNAIESVLWFIIEYFGYGGSKYSRERLMIIRKRGERYEGKIESDGESPSGG